MARLHGEYDSDESREPTRIDVSGTADEIAKAHDAMRPDLSPDARSIPMPDTNWHINIPADREAVKRIARQVEIQCDDARLIDWMRA